ncbi:MAG TPA: hypothetical protein VN229_06670 [Terriglobales bacterium]|nr:hypothetical protein [Terriglobales bacterium]
MAGMLCLLSLSHESLLLIDAPYDIYIPLNAGLRWLQGALPSRDYPSPIGLLYAAVHGLALSFDGTDARSVLRADVAILALSYLLLWPNMRGLAGTTWATILIMLAGMMMTPLALDASWGSYRYVADYNRWAWAFYAVALVWTCNPAGRGRLSDITLSIALCCLLYLKLTVFAGAVLTLAAGCFNDRRIADYIMPCVVVLLAIGGGVASGVLVAYLRDNLAIGGATGSVRLGKLIVQFAAPYNVVPLLLAVALCFIRALPRRFRFLPLYCISIQHAVGLQNFDVMVPLTGVPLLLLKPKLVWPDARIFRPVLVGIPALCQALYLFGVSGVALAWQPSAARLTHAQSISGAGTLGERILTSTLPAADAGIHHGDLAFADDVIVHDMQRAQDLLGRLPVGTRVATLEVSNVAAAAWPRVHPSTGGLLWYDDGRSFSDVFHPSPDQAFAGADIILVPLRFTTASTQKLVALYRPWLDKCATVIAANELWALYRPVTVSTEVNGGPISTPPTGQSSQSLSSDPVCTILARP